MSKKIAIIQSNYIPWKGYFDIINMVDEFILLDEIQYTKRDWRNRNQIKTAQGLQWLTIPVINKGKYHQNINETRISDKSWAKTHWRSISLNYRKSKCYDELASHFDPLYSSEQPELLSQVNYKFITEICNILGIQTKISWSTDYPATEGKNDRLIQLCLNSNAEEYLSGPAARGYLNEEAFARNKIKVSWMNYSEYPDYTQLHGDFEPGVSILDLLFNEGQNAVQFMKSFGQNSLKSLQRFS